VRPWAQGSLVRIQSPDHFSDVKSRDFLFQHLLDKSPDVCWFGVLRPHLDHSRIPLKTTFHSTQICAPVGRLWSVLPVRLTKLDPSTL
jgi:hypothetical protein